MIFFVNIPTKGIYVNSFFSRTARLWKSLPIESFPLTYDLNDFLSLDLTETVLIFSFTPETTYLRS